MKEHEEGMYPLKELVVSWILDLEEHGSRVGFNQWKIGHRVSYDE